MGVSFDRAKCRGYLFTIDANGVFHARQTIPSLPEEFCGENLAAEIRLSANQRFCMFLTVAIILSPGFLLLQTDILNASERYGQKVATRA